MNTLDTDADSSPGVLRTSSAISEAPMLPAVATTIDAWASELASTSTVTSVEASLRSVPLGAAASST
eukprot:177936-Rhodomonas_salina.1